MVLSACVIAILWKVESIGESCSFEHKLKIHHNIYNHRAYPVFRLVGIPWLYDSCFRYKACGKWFCSIYYYIFVGFIACQTKSVAITAVYHEPHIMVFGVILDGVEGFGIFYCIRFSFFFWFAVQQDSRKTKSVMLERDSKFFISCYYIIVL